MTGTVTETADDTVTDGDGLARLIVVEHLKLFDSDSKVMELRFSYRKFETIAVKKMRECLSV